MDKKDEVYMHNGIVLSHKKEQNNVICSNMDATRDYHTKGNKSERERQISYDITYMCWRRAWQSTPIFWPGDSHGQRRLVGYSPQVTQNWSRLKQLSMPACTYMWNLKYGTNDFIY